jgi:uncharacterized protein (DUF58 family)
MLTPRLYLLALGCPVLLVLSAFWALLAPVGFAYGLGMALLAWLDWRAAGTTGQFELQRLHDSKLSLGALNRITVRVRSSVLRPVELTIRDEPPELFVGADKAIVKATAAPRETVEISYEVRPLRRGDFRFGDLHARWAGPLGLVVRQVRFPAAEPVKVYPNLHEIRKYDLLARRDQLMEMGIRHVRLRGEGTEFESLRDYTPDDPYRAINWKATARRGKPISTEYEPERSQRVVVMLDVGRMMRSPVRAVDADSKDIWNMAKVDFVLNSVLLFSYVATLKGDQVGLLVFADQPIQFIPPGAGRAHFQKLLEAMYALESQPVEADYARALNYLGVQQKKRALVVLFTDLSGSRAADALLQQVPRLAPRHVPMVVTIRDPALDQEARQTPDHSDAVYQRAVAEQMLDERRLLLDNLSRRGVLTLDVAAERLTMEVVNRYLEIKARVLV